MSVNLTKEMSLEQLILGTKPGALERLPEVRLTMAHDSSTVLGKWSTRVELNWNYNQPFNVNPAPLIKASK